MKSTFELIQPYLSKPIDGITVEINQHLYLFSLYHYECDLEKEKTDFLLRLQDIADEEFILDSKGSAVYFFTIGKSSIELNVSVSDKIDIKPFLIYNDRDIKEDFDQILQLDYLLHSMLKSKGMQ